MLIIKFIMKFVGILNKDASPQQIAGGMALGAIMGITPLVSLHNLFVFVLVLMIRVNITSAILSLGLFSVFAYVFDPLFNKVGYFLLVDVGALQSLWTALYNTPFVPWTKFNNTLTLGSFVCSLLIFGPLYVLVIWLVKKYREKVMTAIQKWKVVQVFKTSRLYDLYRRYT